MLRWDSLSSPTCQLRTRVWVSVSPTPHPEYIRVSFRWQPLSLTSPPPHTHRAPLLWGVKIWHPRAAGRGASSLKVWCFLIRQFPLCPGSPCLLWGHPTWVLGTSGNRGPRLQSASVACSPPFQLGSQRTGCKPQHGHFLVM